MPTIGVAVAVPEPWATQLQDYRTNVGDLMATTVPTHVTLVPPTDVSDDTMEKIETHLEDVASEVAAFRVRLRGTDSFRPVSPVVFVSLATGVPECVRLADAVRRGPLAVGLAFPYRPHVTIAHHLPDELLDRALVELAAFECAFEVAGFALYVHDPEQGWTPTRVFALAPGA